MAKRRKRRTAKQAGKVRTAQIEDLLARMTKTAKAERERLNDPDFNWADVGDLAATAEILQQASDFIHSEGEYA